MNEKYEDFIGIYDNNVDESLCQELLKWFNWGVEHKYSFTSHASSGMSPQYRNDEEMFIVASSYQYPAAAADRYWECLIKCLKKYLLKYQIAFNGTLHNYEFKVHKVKEGQGYHAWHYEDGDGSYNFRNRFLTYMSYLQAPSEGGETEFLFQSKRIEPVVGRTLIWPPGFTHTHRGNPPLKGEKIYITGWFIIGDDTRPPSYSTNSEKSTIKK